MNFIKTLDYIDIKKQSSNENLQDDKKINDNKFSEFAGMWQDTDINIETIREEA